MEKIEKACTSLNSCVKCSSFNITTQSVIEEESLQINDNCTKFFNSSFDPITKVYFDENTIFLNQTRCCLGNRTLLYNKDLTTDRKILDFSTFSSKDATTNNGTILMDSRSSKTLTIPISVLSMALVGTLLMCVMMVCCCKRQSKIEQRTPSPSKFTENGTHSEEVAEYSTVEESAVLTESLTQQRNPPKINEAPSDIYFILEPKKRLSTTSVDTISMELKECETDGDVYNTLHERRFKEMEENAYSHFVDFDDSVYCSTINQ